VGTFSCCVKTHYLAHYKPAFAFSDILCLHDHSASYDETFPYLGTIQVYHVPPLKRVNLAARYRPGSYMATRKVTPSFLQLLCHGNSRLPWACLCRSFKTGSDIFGIFTTLRLPGSRLPGGLFTCVSNPTLACFATLSDPLFIQDRRFIQ